MKVLLISHPRPRRQTPDFPPIGLAYLGATARDRGHKVLLVDGGLSSIQEIVRRATHFAPDFIGITCWTIDRAVVWALCAQLKLQLPQTFLAIGGPHASCYPEHILARTHATAVVIGEGDDTLCDLLDTIASRGPLSQVRGIAFKKTDGTIERTAKRALIDDLDTIPFPFYGGFSNFTFKNYAGLAGLPRPTAPIITSRGCVFDCTYCGSVGHWGRRWRQRSAQNVLDEIEHLLNDMGARSLYVFDDNFPVNRKRAMAICQGLLDRKLSIQWACCSHVKMVSEELLNAMKASGCRTIDFGVESGSDAILRNIHKGQQRSDIERAFAMTHHAGIRPRAYLMVGNKGETAGTIDETIDMVGRIKPYGSSGATLLWLLPGTRVFDEAKDNGFISDDYWLKCDDVPYNLQEYSYHELYGLRQRLMFGLARKNGGLMPLLRFCMKSLYYRFPIVSSVRSLIPDRLR